MNFLKHPVYVHVSNKRYELVLVTIGGNATRMVKRRRKRGMAWDGRRKKERGEEREERDCS